MTPRPTPKPQRLPNPYRRQDRADAYTYARSQVCGRQHLSLD